MIIKELFNKTDIYPVEKKDIPNYGNVDTFTVDGNLYIVQKDGWELNFAIKKKGDRFFSTKPTEFGSNQFKILNTVLYCMYNIISNEHQAYYFEGHGKLAKLYSYMFDKLKHEIISLGYIGVVAPRGAYTQYLFIPKDEFDYEEWKDDKIYGWDEKEMTEQGYVLSGNVVYGIYVKNGNQWELFDTLDTDNIDKLKKYTDILYNSKKSDIIVIEYNAPSEVPQKITNTEGSNIIYSKINESIKEIYDENYLKGLIPGSNKEYNISYNVKEVKDILTDIFKEEKIKVIKESNYDDDFINVTLLIKSNPLVENTNILMDYAYKKYKDEYVAEEIIDIIESISGMNLNTFTKMIENSKRNYSKSAHEWVKKQVDKLYPKHIKNKDEAFGIAWKQWENKHDN